MKPGYKTTEWWLSLAAVVLGALMAAHVFGDGSTWQRGIGAVVSMLTTLGYTGWRTSIKNNITNEDKPS